LRDTASRLDDCLGLCRGIYFSEEASATATTTKTRSVRIFRNGRSQAIRIPREFALPGNEATISRDRKGRLIVEPVKKPNPMDLVALLHSWEPLSDEDAMPPIDKLTVEPFDL
jgi:antitoxin VapB